MQVKRLIARELKVIIGITVGGFLLAFLSNYAMQHTKVYKDFVTQGGLAWSYVPLSFKEFLVSVSTLFSYYHFPSLTYACPTAYSKLWHLLWLEHLGGFIFLYGYPIYLAFRLIFWGIRKVAKPKQA